MKSTDWVADNSDGTLQGIIDVEITKFLIDSKELCRNKPKRDPGKCDGEVSSQSSEETLG